MFHEDDPLFHNDGSSSQAPRQNDQTLKTGLSAGTSSNFSCGFKTAAGASMKAPSYESLSRAKLLLEECTSQAENSSANKGNLSNFCEFRLVLQRNTVPSVVEICPSKTPKLCDQSSRAISPEAGYYNFKYGFKTASGTALKMPSCESLSRAKRIFEEFMDQIEDSRNHAGCVLSNRHFLCPVC